MSKQAKSCGIFLHITLKSHLAHFKGCGRMGKSEFKMPSDRPFYVRKGRFHCFLSDRDLDPLIVFQKMYAPGLGVLAKHLFCSPVHIVVPAMRVRSNPGPHSPQVVRRLPSF